MIANYELYGKALDKTDNDIVVNIFKSEQDILDPQYLIALSDNPSPVKIIEKRPEIKLGIYHHYKSAEKEYDIFDFAYHLDRRSWVVLYNPLYEVPDFAKTCLRTVHNFHGITAYNDGFTEVFTYIRPNN